MAIKKIYGYNKKLAKELLCGPGSSLIRLLLTETLGCIKKPCRLVSPRHLGLSAQTMAEAPSNTVLRMDPAVGWCMTAHASKRSSGRSNPLPTCSHQLIRQVHLCCRPLLGPSACWPPILESSTVHSGSVHLSLVGSLFPGPGSFLLGLLCFGRTSLPVVSEKSSANEKSF